MGKTGFVPRIVKREPATFSVIATKGMVSYVKFQSDIVLLYNYISTGTEESMVGCNLDEWCTKNQWYHPACLNLSESETLPGRWKLTFHV
jgi:hypothetical protein